ncbi:MAG TPA: DUF2059 domain-containing protein [Xanthomonadales bacterium]|nr:DUF2059 domain-containing protein [Xanthomonadales bacterium]
MRTFLWTIVLVLTPACPTPAAELEHARQLVDLMEVDKQFRELTEQCVAQARTDTAESVYADDSGAFGGIAPGSDLWPEVKALYESYQIRTCTYPAASTAMEMLAKDLAEDLTADEMGEILSFHASKAGRRYLEATSAASTRMNAFMVEQQFRDARTAQAEYLASLSKLVERHTAQRPQ